MRRERRTSWQMTAKSISIKDAERKSGGCAWKAEKLTSGDLRTCPGIETGPVVRLDDRNAEVSRGHSSGGRQVERDTHPKGEKRPALHQAVTGP